MSSLKSFLRRQRCMFGEYGTEAPNLSADLLLAAAIGVSREELLKRCIVNPYEVVRPETEERFNALAARRLTGEPVAYILSRKEFYGREFAVTPATLIPRPETELLIEVALDMLSDRHSGTFADLGTGSGCIAATLALELGPGWQGEAFDISPSALAIAHENAAKLGIYEQLSFILADFHSCKFTPESLDLLASNPPYVSEKEYADIAQCVREFEPKSALVPGTALAGHTSSSVTSKQQSFADGTRDLRHIANLARSALKKGGILLMEMGCTQGTALKSALRESEAAPCWADVRVIKDPAGHDRLLYARKA